LVICQHPETKKFVLIQEGCKNGWWIPAGRVDPGESFSVAAKREMLEEAGIEIDLKGLLCFEYHPFSNGGAKQRMIYYAHPKDLKAELKKIPDFESLRAVWISFAELNQALEDRKIHLRSYEPFQWFRAVEEGVKIHSLDLLFEK
jgi:8-oxo-dGTP pyrophosphatase MutT (NUDIX family)